MQTLKPNLLRQFFIIFLIILFGWLIFKEMATYLSGILGAITLFVLLRKWQEYLVKKRKWNSSVSACVLMAGSFLVILVPIAGLVLMLDLKN